MMRRTAPEVFQTIMPRECLSQVSFPAENSSILSEMMPETVYGNIVFMVLFR